MPEDGQEHVHYHMLLPSRSSFGYKAKNLLNWCKAPTKAKQVQSSAPVGHMSVFNVRFSSFNNYRMYNRTWTTDQISVALLDFIIGPRI
jgi:hypothetical protein